MECLLFAARGLRTLRLGNCPTLTDRVINGLYEAEVAWGKKRNTKSLGLNVLELSGNPNFTWQMMTMISTANPHLKTLDISDCVNIDLNKALHEVENLKNIEVLKIGPSCKAVQVDNFLQVRPYHM